MWGRERRDVCGGRDVCEEREEDVCGGGRGRMCVGGGRERRGGMCVCEKGERRMCVGEGEKHVCVKRERRH